MRSLSRALLLALALLTRLPVARLPVGYLPGDERLAVIFYPLVGLISGGLLWLGALVLAILPPGVAAALLLLLWISLTGAMHLDGLADTIDAYFAAHRHSDPEQRRQRILAVMREPACGPMAVVALVMLLLGKWALLEHMFATKTVTEPGWLLVILLLPRTALLPYVLTTSYARAEGLALALADNLPKLAIGISLLASLALCLFLLPWHLVVTLVLVLSLLTLWWRNLWQRLIGGYTGDCLGALVELLELALLVVCLAAIS